MERERVGERKQKKDRAESERKFVFEREKLTKNSQIYRQKNNIVYATQEK